MNGRMWWALLVLSLVVVAGWTLVAARGALRPAVSRGDLRAGHDQISPVEQAAQLDSLLAAVSTPPRNPFAAPSAPPATARARGALVPPVESPPRVVLLVEDVGGTIVQIEVGGETSARMAVGGTFRGWTVLAISGDGVTVVKGNRQFVLPRP